jgi:hypothetical protein
MRLVRNIIFCFHVLMFFTEEARTEAGAAQRDGVVMSQGYEVGW